MVKLETLLGTFEELWPKSTADDWDRPGLSVGSTSQEISKVLLSVDVTKKVIEEAIGLGAQLVLSHHPLLLRGVSEVSEQSLKGEIVALAIRNSIAVFSTHTNADKAKVGTATALAAAYGVTNTHVLDPESGHGLVGELAESVSLIQFASRIASRLPAVAQGVRVAGNPELTVSRVALSPGAGDADLGKALSQGVDVFITSDLRHHPAQDFIETPGKPRGLIEVSHWASEYMMLPLAKTELATRYPELEFVLSEVRTDPWDFAVMQ